MREWTYRQNSGIDRGASRKISVSFHIQIQVIGILLAAISQKPFDIHSIPIQYHGYLQTSNATGSYKIEFGIPTSREAMQKIHYVSRSL